MRFRVYAIAVSTVLVIVLDVVLIPRFGEHGAAWATVAGEAMLLAGTALGVRRFHHIRRAAGTGAS